MKIFAIQNEYDNSTPTSFLFYYEVSRKFYVEITDNADEWQVPFAFSGLVKKNIRTVNASRSLRWVKERIVPSDRQNILQILKDNGLERYDEYDLLMLGSGRCAQDDYCLVPISEKDLPADIRERARKRVDDAFVFEASLSLLVFFANGEAKLYQLDDLARHIKALSNYIDSRLEYIGDVKIQVGGYGIYWNDSVSVSDAELYRFGQKVSISKNDLILFVSNGVVNVAEAAQILNCSRQNVNDLVKRKRLIPIKETAKEKWFLKSDVQKRLWV